MVSPVLYSSGHLPGALQSGLNAYQDASKGIQQSAHELSGGLRNQQQGLGTSSLNSSNLNASTVNLLNGELQAKAAVEVIKTADGMLGSIIDVFV